jgi:LysM repeat protein
METVNLPITNDSQYQEVIAEIKKIETNVNICYNEIVKYTNEEDIINIQDYINKAKRRKSALFVLAYLYQNQRKNAEIRNDVYTVDQNDTLLRIAKREYSDEGYWKRIYYENELTDINLVLGQQLILPKISDNESVNLFDGFITQLDYINVTEGYDR